MAELPTAAGAAGGVRGDDLLPEADPELESNSWLLWLDFWAQAARNAEVAEVRREVRRALAGDDRRRWCRAGQEAGEFATVDPIDSRSFVSALLDGLTIQIALDDPVVDPVSAYELCMRYHS